MKVDQLFIAGIDTYLPTPVDVKTAVAEGRYDAKEAARTGLESVLVSDRESAPEMAVLAARGALARAHADPLDLSMLLHACAYLQGLEFCSTQSYIHNALFAGHASPPQNALPMMALEVRGCSNGGMSCLELAASYLAAAPDRGAALITTSDKFCAPYVDRWRVDTGYVFADGGSAMVLSKRGGFARVLSVATTSDSTIEGLHRGHDPFGPTPAPIDLFRRKRAFLAEFSVEDMKRRHRTGVTMAAQRALDEAQTDISRIARFCVPHISRPMLEVYLDELKIPESRTSWKLGKRVGHMGAGDQLTALSLMLDVGSLKAGDLCMMLGLGAGCIYSAAVIEILEPPPTRRCPLFS
jgi:3-oxoacyl-[acyl-carrier-protein] synthase-3